MIVTNQSGIARGYFTEKEFIELTAWMVTVFRRENVPIAAVEFCPFHPEATVAQYRRESDDRKPGAGMILRAARRLDLDLSDSILVGDKMTDIEAARRAGIPTRILFCGATSTAEALQADDLRVVSAWLPGLRSKLLPGLPA